MYRDFGVNPVNLTKPGWQHNSLTRMPRFIASSASRSWRARRFATTSCPSSASFLSRRWSPDGYRHCTGDHKPWTNTHPESLPRPESAVMSL